jgi:hypothetical protein
MFTRLARNFIKNGYFPTDPVTLARILTALDVAAQEVRILDPCCGEGVALAEVKQHLTACGAAVTAYGIEYDGERAWHAKALLDRVAHSDAHDVFIGARSFGLLFLNPPYGDAVADKARTGDVAIGERLEKQFFRLSLPWLQFGGVLVLTVPTYALDQKLIGAIARNFADVQVYLAPERTFQQCVLFGVKKRATAPDPSVVQLLEAFVAEGGDTLPECWHHEPYAVPAPESAAPSFTALRIDAPQLVAELERFAANTLWPQFGTVFGTVTQPARAPLRDLSRWHLALALAAGQISGVVHSKDGRTLLIKGDTFKEKQTTVEHTARADGSVAETRILTDIFVPVIRGLDFTPGDSFGAVVTIR